ncbi:hypothetical protein [Arthrobacter sp. LjRoot14]|uniref:hypothetical protein n=1 Tax=Arthrobacter sp. LjRoot14 TaxID=3342265 RepID=UPI003ECDC868
MFPSLAEYERSRLSERTRAGLAAAKAMGRLGGRPPAVNGDETCGSQGPAASGKETAGDRGDSQREHVHPHQGARAANRQAGA